MWLLMRTGRPLGAKERVWLTVLLYTGATPWRCRQARPAARPRWRCDHPNRKEPGRGRGELSLSCRRCWEAVRIGPTADLAFICGASGKAMTKELFGNAFRDACNAAGVRKSAHGVRKIGATRGGRERGDCGPARSHFRLAWRNAWHRITRNRPTGAGWRATRSASSVNDT